MNTAFRIIELVFMVFIMRVHKTILFIFKIDEGGEKMNKKQSKIEKRIMKLLVKEGTQFYDPETGKPISTKEYVALLLAEKRCDLENFLNKLKRKRK